MEKPLSCFGVRADNVDKDIVDSGAPTRRKKPHLVAVVVVVVVVVFGH